MFIRKTACSKYGAKQYFTYRLVGNVRTENGTSQRIVLNLGIDFSFPKENWRSLAKRIEQILYGQQPLFASPDDIEVAAQQYAAKIIRKQEDSSISDKAILRYYSIDIDRLETSRPRSVSIEHVAYETVKKMELEQKFTELGLTRPQRYAAIGTIIGRMVHPGSELATHDWLQNQSGLSELIGAWF